MPATLCNEHGWKRRPINPVIDRLGLPEILGANIHEKAYRLPWLNKERAYTQLISKLLGVEFDTIWQRHKRQLTRKALVWFIGGNTIYMPSGPNDVVLIKSPSR